MNTPPLHAHPVLSADEAKRFEAALFGGDEAKEWAAMNLAGAAIGAAVITDFEEIGGFPKDTARVLVLAGKGHNGGDALLAAKFILERFTAAQAEVLLAFGERALKPLALRAYEALVHAAPGRVRRVRKALGHYALSIDGVFGFQFHPPVDARTATLFAEVNALPIRLRAAVDLPSGLGTVDVMRADFSYATGIVKAPLIDPANAASVGRVRYLDLGFFEGEHTASSAPSVADFVLTSAVLAPLRELRSPRSDKRTYGHLFVVGGSKSFPGAVLMSVLAALKTGAGLVTAFVPESLAAAYAAQVPEAMWVGWPETPEGGLALEGAHLLRERISRASVLLIGPGLSREAETLALAMDIVKTATVPLVLDADALQPEIVRAGKAPRILTPHAGEFARIAGRRALKDFPSEAGEARGGEVVTVLKGPVTRICAGGCVAHSFFGGPVLARGGSGDLLAGIIGGLLGGNSGELLESACRGVVWHGLAADALARERGQVAVRTTELLEFLPPTLRG
ncbi:NAD(P)H-hydrate dehydratase [Nibricoccus aquaticus]|uniref:ADP-dependent (S)-NAD(P)H-hydrate dehydratase n=1 Tax=Nibricoccus aquaticus TaxID=2576891 RepID=A0A290Q563_9BACT|nr:NAD(P)H-hydrate dehydratase [Nibricoccus aquaticus]ATC63825.1 NAD(P)H-hydrate dehydratase [Nibricoccus aquaticus]